MKRVVNIVCACLHSIGAESAISMRDIVSALLVILTTSVFSEPLLKFDEDRLSESDLKALYSGLNVSSSKQNPNANNVLASKSGGGEKKLVVVNPTSLDNVAMSMADNVGESLKVTPLLVAELRNAGLDYSDNYDCIFASKTAEGDYAVMNIMNVRVPDEVVLPTFRYGRKGDVKTALTAERKIKSVSLNVPMPIFGSDVSAEERSSAYAKNRRMALDNCCYTYQYELPNGDLTTYSDYGLLGLKSGKPLAANANNVMLAADFEILDWNQQLNFEDGTVAHVSAASTVAKQSITAAAATWNSFLTIKEQIYVLTGFSSDFYEGDSSVLGSSFSPPTYTMSSTGIAYPAALIDQILEADMHPDDSDITILYNAGFAFYFGTDGNCPSTKCDFQSVVTHELCHGLGFSSYHSRGSDGEHPDGDWSTDGNVPSIFDTFLYYSTGRLPGLTKSTRKAALTSNALYWDGPNAKAANGNSRVKMYAPSTYAGGSSVSHWDNSVTFKTFMKFKLQKGEVCHEIDSRLIGALKDMGWKLQGETPTIPAAPTVSISGTTMLWDAVAGAKYYKVYRSTNPFADPVAVSGWLTARTYTVTKPAAEGTCYFYFVKAASEQDDVTAGPFNEVEIDALNHREGGAFGCCNPYDSSATLHFYGNGPISDIPYKAESTSLFQQSVKFTETFGSGIAATVIEEYVEGHIYDVSTNPTVPHDWVSGVTRWPSTWTLKVTASANTSTVPRSYAFTSNANPNNYEPMIWIHYPHYIYQAGVDAFSVDKTMQEVGKGCSTNRVSITATPTTAAWTAKVSDDAKEWITLYRTSSKGSGVLGYVVDENDTGVSRTGYIILNGMSLKVTQAGDVATVKLASIAISGASSVTSGENTTYTCTATMSDGTTKTVTPTWSISSGTSFATINSSGKLTASTVTSSQSVTVKANYAEGGVTKTATKTITIKPFLPSVPSVSVLTWGTNTSNTSYIDVSWTGGDGATSFNLYRSTSGTRPSSPFATNVTSPYRDYKSASGLIPGDIYYYWVEAVNSAGSAYSSYDWGNILVSLSLGKSSVSCAASGGSGSVAVAANTSWSATADVSWITFTTSSGSGNGMLSYMIAANATASSRSGTITVAAGLGTEYPLVKVIPVTQDTGSMNLSFGTGNPMEKSGWPSALFLTSKSGSLAAQTEFEEGEPIYLYAAFLNESAVTIPVVTNQFRINTGISINVYWSNLSAGRIGICTNKLYSAFQNLPAGSYVLTYTLDVGDAIRESVETDNERTINFEIKKKAVLPPMPVASPSWGTSSDCVVVAWRDVAGAESYDLYRATSLPCPDSPMWTNVTAPFNDETAMPGVKYYYWVAAKNSAGVTISMFDVGYRAVELSLGKDADSYAASGGSGNVSVAANTSWSASADVGWITLGTASGNGGGTLTYVVGENAMADSRVGTITVTAGAETQYPATKTISVTQEGVVSQDFTIVNGVLLEYAGKGGAVTIPPNVTSIGEEAFAYCSELTSVAIPPSVTSIGDSAFLCCSGLTSVTIPSSVTSIGSYAFAYCNELTSVTIPSSVICIGGSAFCKCSGLRCIDVDSGNKYYCSIDGVLYNKDATELICCPPGARSVTIPSSVTSIGYEAFAYCNELTSVAIPPSVTSIGIGAFLYCSGLASVTISSSVTSISRYAFWYCGSLTSVTIPPNVTSIGDYAFEYCSGLASVTMPSSVTRIDAYAFGRCEKLIAVYVDQGDGNRVKGLYDWSCTVEFIELAVATPTISPPDGSTFDTERCTVTITCATEGAEIYYTTNGGTPRIADANRYTGPFTIGDTATIVAVAVKGEKTSEYVEATITKVIPEPLTLVGVLDEPKLADVTTGGDAEWLPIEDATAKVGGSCAVSGALDESDDELCETWLEAKVYGKGTLTFWWRVSCEPDPRGRYTYDFAAFEADDEVVVRKDGESDWVQVTKTFATDGVHVIRWTYNTDGWPCDDYDGCVWVDGVTWSGSATPEEPFKPTIEGDAGATVTGDAETGFVVKPSVEKTAVEVTIPQGVDAAKVTVEVSPKVASVKPNGAKVKIVSGKVDITEFLNVPAADGNGVVDLTKAKVKEEIVKETLDPEKGAVVNLSGGPLGTADPVITTAPTREGLFYTFSEGRTLDGMERSAGKPGDGKPWSPEIKVKGGNSAFYSIGVGKGE